MKVQFVLSACVSLALALIVSMNRCEAQEVAFDTFDNHTVVKQSDMLTVMNNSELTEYVKKLEARLTTVEERLKAEYQQPRAKVFETPISNSVRYVEPTYQSTIQYTTPTYTGSQLYQYTGSMKPARRGIFGLFRGRSYGSCSSSGGCN